MDVSFKNNYELIDPKSLYELACESSITIILLLEVIINVISI